MTKTQYQKMYTAFRKSHPLLKKDIMHWCPSAHFVIEIWMRDGSIVLYDAIKQQATLSNKRWKVG